MESVRKGLKPSFPQTLLSSLPPFLLKASHPPFLTLLSSKPGTERSGGDCRQMVSAPMVLYSNFKWRGVALPVWGNISDLAEFG